MAEKSGVALSYKLKEKLQFLGATGLTYEDVIIYLYEFYRDQGKERVDLKTFEKYKKSFEHRK